MTETRLRGKKARILEPWPLGTIPREVIIEISKQLVHRLATGHADINGDDFGTIFANAIGGIHRQSPLGIADVVKDENAWSVKTIKHNRPFRAKQARLISGRNSPNYSQGIENPHKDLRATGKSVLDIWNARVNETLNEFKILRIAVLIRNMETREFVLFEEAAERYAADNYNWTKNRQGNLEGRDKTTNVHKFTWQFHGSQFTRKCHIPGSATRFRIDKEPEIIDMEHVLELARFEDDWIAIL